jgi:hypothetical protein
MALASEARDVVGGMDPDEAGTARLRQDELAAPILGQTCGLNLRIWLLRCSTVLVLYRPSERSYSGACATVAIRVACRTNSLESSVDKKAAPRFTLDVLPICLTAGAGRATHTVMIRSDDDVNYGRADGLISDYRICLTSAIVECL